MKIIYIYELFSLFALAVTLYLVSGTVGQKEIEVFIMYSIFMVGGLGYALPMLIAKKNRKLFRRKADKVNQSH